MDGTVDRDLRHRRAAWIVIPAAMLIVLGAEWAVSRTRSAETPRWDDDAFIALNAAPGAPPVWDERWAVAVHLGCPHCRTSLASLAAARDRSGAAIRVTALIVDASQAPADSILTRLPADESRWDADGRWRRRWGHRLYGEVFCFDPRGSLLRTLPPLSGPDQASRFLSVAGIERMSE